MNYANWPNARTANQLDAATPHADFEALAPKDQAFVRDLRAEITKYAGGVTRTLIMVHRSVSPQQAVDPSSADRHPIVLQSGGIVVSAVCRCRRVPIESRRRESETVSVSNQTQSLRLQGIDE